MDRDTAIKRLIWKVLAGITMLGLVVGTAMTMMPGYIAYLTVTKQMRIDLSGDQVRDLESKVNTFCVYATLPLICCNLFWAVFAYTIVWKRNPAAPEAIALTPDEDRSAS